MRWMMSFLLCTAAYGLWTTTAAQSPRVHRLEASPSTVAYGYYWAEAKPALTIASGDIIDVEPHEGDDQR